MADRFMGIDLLPTYKVQVDGLAAGDTVRVNHEDCSAGEDKRRRLYITRPHSNPVTVIAYCHNCQQSGYMATGTHETYRNDKHSGDVRSNPLRILDTLIVPRNLISLLSDWPIAAQSWALKNKLHQTLLSAYSISYDPTSERVYLPRFNYILPVEDGKLMGYQLRNVDPNSPVSKYLTTVLAEDKGFTLIGAANIATTLVFVEDYVSGIHVFEAGRGQPVPYTVLVNYGTKVNLEACYCAAQYDDVVVWLDNDSVHVKDQAVHITRTINMIVPHTYRSRINIAKDPKHYQAVDIQRLINERRSGNGPN